MSCECGSDKILYLGGKCSDLAYAQLGEVEKDGYVPYIAGIGGGDYIEMSICVECHRVQGFDMTEKQIVAAIKGDEDFDEDE